MAFDRKFMANMGVSMTTGFVPTPWAYISSTDTLATIKTANYFDDFKDQLAINDNMYIVGTDGAQYIKITAVSPNVTVATLASENQSHVVAIANTHTTAGGSTTEVITVTGALSSDLAFVMLETEGGAPVTVDAAKAGAGNITVEFSADPSTDHVVSYMLLRAV